MTEDSYVLPKDDALIVNVSYYIKCRDCVYYTECDSPARGFCDIDGREVDRCDFCSWFHRKEEKKMKIVDIIVRAFALLPYVYLIYAVKEERHG